MDKKDICEIDLPEQFTIASVSKVCEKLLESMDYGKQICLKAGNVARADVAALQLLQSYFNSAADVHLEITWDNPSEQLIESAKIVGLSESLGF